MLYVDLTMQLEPMVGSARILVEPLRPTFLYKLYPPYYKICVPAFLYKTIFTVLLKKHAPAFLNCQERGSVGTQIQERPPTLVNDSYNYSH